VEETFLSGAFNEQENGYSLRQKICNNLLPCFFVATYMLCFVTAMHYMMLAYW